VSTNDGGTFTLLIDETPIASHAFGTTAKVKRASLIALYQPPATGMYTLKLENTRSLASNSQLYNYIDYIELAPLFKNLEVDKTNISCSEGATVNLLLSPGAAHGGKAYWIWMSASGTYPGVFLGGMNVPLNWDALLLFTLANPNFSGSQGFTGLLDGTGSASASLDFPTDSQQSYVGIPFCFAYGIASAGPSLTLSFVSHPVHVKYVP
jgi:hypothetical protein